MSDLISRQAAIEVLGELATFTEDWSCHTWMYTDDVYNAIKQLPPIQPDIVRCKDCKHFESEYEYCDYYQWNMTGCDFCSKAEKREVTT